MTTVDVKARVKEFLESVSQAMGLSLTATVTDSDGGLRADLEGEGGEALLWQRGDALRALQTIVNTAFRADLGEGTRVLLDCQHWRRDKDEELKQMAKFLAEKARLTGAPQEMGPLNSYERRIVHMAVAEEPGVTSESIGDASVKQVIISIDN